MKRLLTYTTTIAFSMSLATVAVAADAFPRLYTPDDVNAAATRSFSGLWIGVNGQYGQSHTEVSGDYKGTEVFNLSGISGMGGKLGVEGGGDIQIGRAVVGLSGGFDWSHLDSEASLGGFTAEVENGNSYYGQARAGVAFSEHTLFYALARYTFQEGAKVTWTGGGSYELEDRQGPGVGGGIETFVTDNVTLKVEYVHNFFDKEEVLSDGDFTLNEETDEDLVKLGVNYRF